jgi:hypothetical protein
MINDLKLSEADALVLTKINKNEANETTMT